MVKNQPDYTPINHRLLTDGERITVFCMMWSPTLCRWEDVSPLMVGQPYTSDRFNGVYFSIPRSGVSFTV